MIKNSQKQYSKILNLLKYSSLLLNLSLTTLVWAKGPYVESGQNNNASEEIKTQEYQSPRNTFQRATPRRFPPSIQLSSDQATSQTAYPPAARDRHSESLSPITPPNSPHDTPPPPSYRRATRRNQRLTEPDDENASLPAQNPVLRRENAFRNEPNPPSDLQ